MLDASNGAGLCELEIVAGGLCTALSSGRPSAESERMNEASMTLDLIRPYIFRPYSEIFQVLLEQLRPAYRRTVRMLLFAFGVT